MKDKAKAIVPGVMIWSHGTLSWEEVELLEQTGGHQEGPVLCQDLQIRKFCFPHFEC